MRHGRSTDRFPVRPGLISKHGRLRVRERRTGLKTWRNNLRDLFNWLLSRSTLFLLLLFVSAYVLSYLLFGCFWYAIHKNNARCINDVEGFATAFLFSIETQSTIGYGTKHVAGHCNGGIIMLLIQNIWGNLLDACLVGLIFARLTRPNKRRFTLRCSSVAVIRYVNDQRCLSIRVGDMLQQHSPLIGCSCRLYLVEDVTTVEGELLPYNTVALTLDHGAGSSSEQPFLAIPQEVRHIIDENSPLNNVACQNDLEERRAELIFVLEGTISVRPPARLLPVLDVSHRLLA
ncbi:uncharacterized protein MONBRDRAFT_32445 [Monosiga brevicollis MX1]|uniref:Inward rectifier potassium channel C-terminal domain-containing protein n=1 Tax=Monosiga brevicollis TaxID=81824 RepID=A9UZJ5_MONBE|nr:uncharacterized protein MONBRDRAFT_32445 [Monosiga brevicollis MX1]EDQ89241.1 predicted protein [Monosiga brevicollis MX1]|eukprot:XP_001745817.1 hypothetical protein [Monosiga brevicollis MX1]